MAEPKEKLDRSYLKRHAQRIQSYSSLVSKSKAFKYMASDKSLRRCKDLAFNNNFELDENDNKTESVPQQGESKLSSVMTRSAARKYASVGAIHNKVNIERELKVWKPWPVSVSYQTPKPPNNAPLRQAVSSSLDHVMLLCKYASSLKDEGAAKIQSESVVWEVVTEAADFIDLSPYLTQEPTIVSENNETQITLHLNESLLSNQSMNIISLTDDDQSGTLTLQEGGEDLETITLHSGETYVLDNKYLANTENSKLVNLNETNATLPTISSDHSLSAVYNDHTYAAKLTEKLHINNFQLKEVSNFQPCQAEPPITKVQNKEHQLEFQNALSSLLLDTAILKCLICGDSPQEMITFFNNAG